MADSIDVLLADCPSYDTERLKFCLDRFDETLDIGASLAGKQVMLKPNLISSRGAEIACPNTLWLVAVAEWFIDRGARVYIGDSPAFGTAEQVMRKRGMSSALAHLDVTVVNFVTPVPKELSHGVRISVAREALECDLFVNLPKVKAHSQMFVTLAVKNLFGIVVGMRKGLAHMKNGVSHDKFADLMLDLVELLPSQVSLIDGVVAMHRQGPVNGDRLALGCLGASRDPVALDTSLLDVLDLEPRNCPIYRAAKKRQLAGGSREHLQYPLSEPADFHGSGFTAPTILNPVPFNPFRFIVSTIRRTAAAMRS